MYVCVPPVCLVHREIRGEHQMIVSYYVGVGNPDSLEEQVLFTAEPSFQPCVPLFDPQASYLAEVTGKIPSVYDSRLFLC